MNVDKHFSQGKTNIDQRFIKTGPDMMIYHKGIRILNRFEIRKTFQSKIFSLSHFSIVLQLKHLIGPRKDTNCASALQQQTKLENRKTI